MNWQDSPDVSADVESKRRTDTILAAQGQALQGDFTMAQNLAAVGYGADASFTPSALAEEQHRRDVTPGNALNLFTDMVIPAALIWGGGYLGASFLAEGAGAATAVGADTEAEVLVGTDALTSEGAMGDEWMNIDEWGGSGGGGSGIGGGDFVGDLPLATDVGEIADAGYTMQVGQIAQGAMSLGRALLTRAGIGAAAGAARVGGTIAMNGVRMSVKALWPAIRKYGPQAVAAALGVSVASLMEMAFAADPSMGAGRRRRRGISARDVKTTRRVVNFVTRISHQIGCVRAPRHFSRRRAHA